MTKSQKQSKISGFQGLKRVSLTSDASSLVESIPSVTAEVRKPRAYISWSQLQCFEKNPEDYYRKYVLGEEQFVSNAMHFGKKIAEALENQESLDPETRLLITLIPKCELRETDIRATYHGVTLLAKPDTHDSNMLMFREYKTGRWPWTQKKVDEHGQLLFYATAMWLNTKKIPTAYLDWIPTEYGEDGFLKMTGEIISFKRSDIKITDISQMWNRIKKANEGIKKLWQRNQSNT